MELVNLEGTPFQSGMTSIEIPSYHSMEITYHSISYQTIQYHTIPPHTIPYHVIPYHHSKPVMGCWVSGVLLQNMKIISAGCSTGPLASIFCWQVPQIFVIILDSVVQGFVGKGLWGMGRGQGFGTLTKPLPSTWVWGLPMDFGRVRVSASQHDVWVTVN